MSLTKTEIRQYGRNARTWAEAVVDEFTLTPSEALIAREVCRGIDRLDELADVLQGLPLTVVNRFGETVTHPLVVEQRLLAQSVARLIGSLRLPEPAADDTTTDKSTARTGGKQPRRVQVRGPYGTYGPGARDAVSRLVGA